jgi:hypothetical protein
MDPTTLKANFEEQIANTEKQITDLEKNLAKAKEYKIKLEGGLETIGLLEGDGAAPEGASEGDLEAPTE